MLLALVAGLLAAGLSYLASHSAPSAVLAGSGAAAAALLLFHAVIADNGHDE